MLLMNGSELRLEKDGKMFMIDDHVKKGGDRIILRVSLKMSSSTPQRALYSVEENILIGTTPGEFSSLLSLKNSF